MFIPIDISSTFQQNRKFQCVIKSILPLNNLHYLCKYIFNFCIGYSDPLSAGCKQYTVGFTALDDSSSTATAEIAVNGMDPPELGFSPTESTTETSGQSHLTHNCPNKLSTSATKKLISLLLKFMLEPK